MSCPSATSHCESEPIRPSSAATATMKATVVATTKRPLRREKSICADTYGTYRRVTASSPWTNVEAVTWTKVQISPAERGKRT
jgi:hypothetical protein